MWGIVQGIIACFVLLSVIFFYFRLVNMRVLSTDSEGKKYKYQIVLVQCDGTKTTICLYSNFGQYTVGACLNNAWDDSLVGYVFYPSASTCLVIPKDSLCRCIFEVENIMEVQQKKDRWVDSNDQ